MEFVDEVGARLKHFLSLKFKIGKSNDWIYGFHLIVAMVSTLASLRLLNLFYLKKSYGATDRRYFNFILNRRFVLKISWWRYRQEGKYCLMQTDTSHNLLCLHITPPWVSSIKFNFLLESLVACLLDSAFATIISVFYWFDVLICFCIVNIKLRCPSH